MAKWAVVLTGEQYAQERLYANEVLDTGALHLDAVPPGDEALLVAVDGDPVLFGVGRGDEAGHVKYTFRIFDEPLGLEPGELREPGVRRLDDAAFAAVAGRIDPRHRVDADKRTWLVSVDLPIEAATPGEAVRAFWTYVRELGPGELPAFVWPAGDELAMQAFVLGEESNQDPEED